MDIGSTVSFRDLAGFDPVLHSTLKDNVAEKVLAPELSSALGLDFTALEDFDVRAAAANRNTGPRFATEQDKGEYLRLLARKRLFSDRRRQVEAIASGFAIFGFRARVGARGDDGGLSIGDSRGQSEIPGLGPLRPQDLRRLLCGPENVDPDRVLSNIDFDSGHWQPPEDYDGLGESRRVQSRICWKPLSLSLSLSLPLSIFPISLLCTRLT